MKQTAQLSMVANTLKSLTEKEQTQVKGGIVIPCPEKRPAANASENAWSNFV